MLLLSVYHRRISVFTKSAKYEVLLACTAQVASVIQSYIVLILIEVLDIAG